MEDVVGGVPSMRVLITGGSGFIGSHLAEYFQDRAEVRIQTIIILMVWM